MPREPKWQSSAAAAALRAAREVCLAPHSWNAGWTEALVYAEIPRSRCSGRVPVSRIDMAQDLTAVAGLVLALLALTAAVVRAGAALIVVEQQGVSL